MWTSVAKVCWIVRYLYSTEQSMRIQTWLEIVIKKTFWTRNVPNICGNIVWFALKHVILAKAILTERNWETDFYNLQETRQFKISNPRFYHGRSMLHFEKVCITRIDFWLKRAFDLLALVKWPISKLYRCSQPRWTPDQQWTLGWNFSPSYFVISV